MKYLLKFRKQENLTTYFSDYAILYKQNTTEKWMKGCILHFPKKGGLGITKNYRGITLTAIAAKVYNNLFLKWIWPEN